MSIFGSGFGGFGRTKSPVELIAPTIIAKCPIIPKKSRKKSCDFIRTVSDSGLKKGDVIGVHRSAVFTTITAYTPDAVRLSIFPMKGAISAAISASAEQLSRSSKTEHRMFLS